MKMGKAGSSIYYGDQWECECNSNVKGWMPWILIEYINYTSGNVYYVSKFVVKFELNCKACVPWDIQHTKILIDDVH
jgi:hypothetical protein